MPELPEVETVVRQIKPRIEGCRIKKIQIDDPKLESPLNALIPGRKIEKVFREGKQIAIELSEPKKPTNRVWLLIHLRMTGRLIWAKSLEEAKEREDRKPRFYLILDQGCLLFYDLRRFGTLDVIEDYSTIETKGVDPLSRKFTEKKLKEMLTSSRQEMKAFLMRQDKIIGLGNIYASEILFDVGISPKRMTNEIADQEIKSLYLSTKKILKKAIKNCGTTFSDFQDAHGVTGSYQNLLKVYGNEDKPCPNCNSKIIRIVQQQRSTFYCEKCQR